MYVTDFDNFQLALRELGYLVLDWSSELLSWSSSWGNVNRSGTEVILQSLLCQLNYHSEPSRAQIHVTFLRVLNGINGMSTVAYWLIFGSHLSRRLYAFTAFHWKLVMRWDSRAR